MIETKEIYEFILSNGLKYLSNNINVLLLIPELLNENINIILDYYKNKRVYDYVGDYSEGLAIVKKGKKFGYINQFFEEIIIPKYDGAFDFQDGLARVKINNTYGYINKLGEEVIKCQYDDAKDFHEGLALVKRNNKYGI